MCNGFQLIWLNNVIIQLTVPVFDYSRLTFHVSRYNKFFMHKTLFACMIAGTFFFTSCDKKENSSNPGPETALQGTWVRVDDAPGRQPADTLRFFRKNGKDLLAFYSAGSPGAGWPSQTETEYRFDNGKLSYNAFTGSSPEFYTVDSFEWITTQKTFSIKLYQFLLYMSADYRVTYQKIKW